VHTCHTDYDEHDPYIVVAEDEEAATKLVEQHEEFRNEMDSRKRRNAEKQFGVDSREYGIKGVEEVPLTEGRVVWAVYNRG